MFTKWQKLLWLYSLWIFHGGVKWYHIRALGYNLLIRPRVQVYFHSDTCYIINGNLGLVKSWQICLRPIGARTLFIPLVPSQATYKSPIGLAQKEEKTVFLCSIFWVHFSFGKATYLRIDWETTHLGHHVEFGWRLKAFSSLVFWISLLWETKKLGALKKEMRGACKGTSRFW